MSNRILTLPIALALVFLSLCISSALSIAQSYPTKPIRIVVPFPPGGSNDTVARVVAAKLSEKLGQTVITDNRPGSGGNVGLELVEKSASDGYSLLVHSLEFESRNLIRVTVIGKTAYLLVVHPSVPVKTAKEMVALARAKPSSLTYASSGVGSVAHIAMEQFAFAAGLELVHVPYKGMAPAMVDLLGGQIQTAFFHPSQAGASVDSGRVRAIGISALVRDPRVPSVPTIQEQLNIPFSYYSRFAVYAPASTPLQIVTRLNQEINQIVANSENFERLVSAGVRFRPDRAEGTPGVGSCGADEQYCKCRGGCIPKTASCPTTCKWRPE